MNLGVLCVFARVIFPQSRFNPTISNVLVSFLVPRVSEVWGYRN
jgi:hypothetical protein